MTDPLPPRTYPTYIADNPIRMFDGIQRQEAKEQAESMRDPKQELNEYIKFGRVWRRDGYGLAVLKYEAGRARRALENSTELEESA